MAEAGKHHLAEGAGAGEAWWEPVGAIHRVSRNAGATEPATLLAIDIAPTGATAEQLMKPM